MTTALELEKTYTIADFEALPDNGKEYELIRGELLEMPGPSTGHGIVISILDTELRLYNRKVDVGQVLPGIAFVLDPENAPRPDLAFVVKERLIGINYYDAFPGPPDLAVEVVSRTDVTFNVDDKVEDYLKAGVRLVWVINPRNKLVFVYHPNADKPQVLGLKDELDGENIIPGFKLPVKTLFE